MDLSVSGLIDGGDELIDLGTGDLSVGFHVLEGIIDEVGDFSGIETLAVIGVVFGEHGIDGGSELLVSV